ncbi:hypothetical protein EV183_003479 [Coemansia sp. RSA 2336]|nr:hypothetical protein EV183_003479 [Coemansia sp. RSA 2336]
MAHFYIPTTTQHHPAIRKDILDISFEKLQGIKQAQRVTHRPVNLHKTVLVYNTFKAALSIQSQAASKPDAAMDVDEKKAEQTWFDNCIDDMLMDEEQSLDEEQALSDEDDDYAVEEVPPSNPTVVTTDLTVFDTISSDFDRYICKETSIPANLLFKLLRKRAVVRIDQGKRLRLHGNNHVFPGMSIEIPADLATTSSKPTVSPESPVQKHFVLKQLPAIFANESLMVVQKPVGLACQGGTKVKYSVDTLLASVSEFADYKLVHRLDRGTSGALVVAKSRLAAVALTRAFHNHNVTKKYTALLEGIPQYMQGTIHNPLLYTGNGTIAIGAEQPRDAAKCATTKYKVLKTGVFKTPCSLVSVEILTGRKHQIRAHCAQVLGCPVYGDTKYGAANSTLYLHCAEITIPNVLPDGSVDVDRPTITVKSPFPKTWQPVFDSLDINFTAQ